MRTKTINTKRNLFLSLCFLILFSLYPEVAKANTLCYERTFTNTISGSGGNTSGSFTTSQTINGDLYADVYVLSSVNTLNTNNVNIRIDVNEGFKTFRGSGTVTLSGSGERQFWIARNYFDVSGTININYKITNNSASSYKIQVDFKHRSVLTTELKGTYETTVRTNGSTFNIESGETILFEIVQGEIRGVSNLQKTIIIGGTTSQTDVTTNIVEDGKVRMTFNKDGSYQVQSKVSGESCSNVESIRSITVNVAESTGGGENEPPTNNNPIYSPGDGPKLLNVYDFSFFWGVFAYFLKLLAPFLMIIIAIIAVGLLLKNIVKAIRSRQ